MFTSDMRKLVSRLVILIVLVSWLALLTYPSQAVLLSSVPDELAVSDEPRQEHAPIKVIVDQLHTEKGLIPIEIQQVQVSSDTANQIDNVSYLVRNNTHKEIIAFAVSRSIEYEEGGTEYPATSSDTAEFALHPDFNETSRVKSLAPGGIEAMESAGAITLSEGAIIKAVRLRIDYAQFSDGSSIGSGSEGEHQIKLAREGAAKYKAWLKGRYIRSGKSLTAVLSLLQNDLSEELGLKDSSEILGANNYRIRLLRVFQTDGAERVQRYLNR